MDQTSAIIADDEAPLRAYLIRLLKQVWPSLSIIAEAENGQQALELIQQHQPDITFLDIKMPGLTGLEVAEAIQGQTHIVMVTAYDEFAIQAFNTEAIDYLLKPVSEDRLCKTVERLQQRLNQPPADLGRLLQQLQKKPVASYLQWIKASFRDEVHVLAVAVVLYFRSADKYTSVITSEREYVVRSSLKELQSQLDPAQFWRIHRGILISVAQILSSSKDISGHMSVLLQDKKTRLAVSRSYQYLFKAE